MESQGISPSGSQESWPSRLDAALGEWRFSLNFNSGKFEVLRANRPELAHLTISWGTESRTLDIHLTYGHEQASVSGGEKDWRPLVQVPLAALEARGASGNDIVRQSLVPKLLENYKKWRPDWLAAQGYLIAVVDETGVREWFRAEIAPKRGGKFRFQPSVALEPNQFPREAVQQYEPHVLHLEVLKTPGSRVHAAPQRNPTSRAESILLTYTLGPDGTFGWWGIKNKHLLAVMRDGIAMLFDWLTPRLTSDGADKVAQMITGLGLEEDEGARPLVRSLRLAAIGRNPVRQPYPRMG